MKNTFNNMKMEKLLMMNMQKNHLMVINVGLVHIVANGQVTLNTDKL